MKGAKLEMIEKSRMALMWLAGLCLFLGPLNAQDQLPQLTELVTLGKSVFNLHCAGCHGEKGDGAGPAADMLITKPRDFTSGVFKFRSTPSGALPTDEDLFRTITRGIFRTSMPTWSLLPERERLSLVQYLKTFSDVWQRARPASSIMVPEPPEFVGSPESVARGKELYSLLECWKCHGETGKGDGPSSKTLDPDQWGNPQKPFNFTRGSLKGGPSKKDVYRTFMTGLNGTAMPSYNEIFSEPDGEYIMENDAWHLISFVVSLRGQSMASSH